MGLSATATRLAMRVLITEYTLQPAAASPPTERAPGIFCAMQAPEAPPPPQLAGVLIPTNRCLFSGSRPALLPHSTCVCLRGAGNASCAAVILGVPCLPRLGWPHCTMFWCAFATGLLQRWQAADVSTLRRLGSDDPGSPLPRLLWRLEAGQGMTITAAPLAHRLPCWGYVFQVFKSAHLLCLQHSGAVLPYIVIAALNSTADAQPSQRPRHMHQGKTEQAKGVMLSPVVECLHATGDGAGSGAARRRRRQPAAGAAGAQGGPPGRHLQLRRHFG